MSRQIKLYVGCSLTHAPSDFTESIASLKKKLSMTYEVFDFIGVEKGTAQDVYSWDIKRCVADCDLFVAVCDFSSTGLGYELGTAVEALRKPVLAIAHRDAHITRLIQGIQAPHFTFERYDDVFEIEDLIQRKLDVLGLVL